MDEKELKQYLSALVLEFATKMNEIETYIYLKSEEDEDDEKDWFEEFNKRYQPVFEAYCTDKKRVYGGNPRSFGCPPEYSGIESAYEQKLSLKMSLKKNLYLRQKLNNLVIQAFFLLLSKIKTAGKLTVIKDGVTGRKSG